MRVRYCTSLILYSKGKAGFDSKSRQIDFCLLVASETKNLPMSNIEGLKIFPKLLKCYEKSSEILPFFIQISEEIF